jgi:drug/metabolite transporter (DMT)-like permease
MSPHTRNLLQIHTAVLLFGFAALFGKFLNLTPIVLVFARVVLAALTLLAAAALWSKLREPLPRRRLFAFAVLGALLAVHWTTFFQSVQTAGVAVAVITYSTFPVFVVLLEPLFFRERLRRGDVVLAAVALAGVALLSPRVELGERATQGVLWGIASGLTFALLSLLNRKYVRQHASGTIALYQDLFASVVLLPFVVRDWPTLSARDLLLLGVLGVLCTAFAHTLFIAGMHGVSARTASTIACLEPVYAMLLATVILDEVPSTRTSLGGVLVLSVAFYATVRARPPHVQPAKERYNT